MLKSRDFWIGLGLGVLLYYLYMNHMKKPGA
jgi:hypothetical protein